MFEEYIPEKDCINLPVNIIEINIPAGATINIVNLLELTSPSGICLMVRIPLLGTNNKFNLAGIIDSLKKVGVTVEAIKE